MKNSLKKSELFTKSRYLLQKKKLSYFKCFFNRKRVLRVIFRWLQFLFYNRYFNSVKSFGFLRDFCVYNIYFYFSKYNHIGIIHYDIFLLLYEPSVTIFHWYFTQPRNERSVLVLKKVIEYLKQDPQFAKKSCTVYLSSITLVEMEFVYKRFKK